VSHLEKNPDGTHAKVKFHGNPFSGQVAYMQTGRHGEANMHVFFYNFQLHKKKFFTQKINSYVISDYMKLKLNRINSK
jgi:hypothetical protein